MNLYENLADTIRVFFAVHMVNFRDRAP